jgi:hypothetical protein
LTSWYNYRIANAADSLDGLCKERDSTIEKLKLATKYNSTQQLLEKYGGVAKQKEEDLKEKKNQQQPDRRISQPERTMMPPPPTANIRRQSNLNPAEQKPPQPVAPSSVPASSAPPSPLPRVDVSAEFAPNAYDVPSQYAPSNVSQSPGWLDRVVNALLGEDDTRPDSRLALICTKCRLVNGLAAPGLRTLEEVGKWRCSSCNAWNGMEIATPKPTSPDHSRSSSAVLSSLEQMTEKMRKESTPDEE